MWGSQAMEVSLKSMEGGAGIRKNQTLICAPIMGHTVAQMLELMHKAKLKGADLVEVRLDHMKSFNPDVDIEKMIKESPLPTLFTYRLICLHIYSCDVNVIYEREYN